MTSFVSDIRYALRQFRRSPGFAAAVVITLALGIGANATLFGVIDRVLLRPFPGIPEPDRVVEVASRGVSHPAFRDLREHTEGVVGLAGYRNRTFAVGDGSRTELATTVLVSGNYFEVLGAQPTLGRLLTDADDVPGALPVAVLSHAYWQQALGADPNFVGRTLTVNGSPVMVVGVAGPEATGTRVLYRPDLWVPMASWPAVAPSGLAGFPLDQRTWNWITLVGRLAPGVSVAGAEAALNAGADRQRELYPDQTPTEYTFSLTPLLESATGLADRGAVVGFLKLLSVVAALVLLIACANVASLLIARTATRQEELGVRGALGAGRGRLARQFFTEALVLGVAGTVAAIGVVAASIPALGRLSLPGGIALGGLDMGVDLRVIACAALVGLLACVAFGVVPAWHASRRRPAPLLRHGADSHRFYRLRTSLLAGQVALCLVLLVGTGLFVRSLRNAMAEDPGFRTENLFFAGVNLGLARYDAAAAEQFYREVVERVEAVPGMQSATWALTPPFMGSGHYSESFNVDGYVPAPDERLEAEMNAVGPGFFRTLDIQITRGRGFEAGDRGDAPFVAVINETLAARYFGDRDPMGQRLGLVGRDAIVVGVARDVAYGGLGVDPEPNVYVPLAQVLGLGGLGEVMLITHAPGSVAGTLPAIRDAIAGVAPAVPIFALSDIGDLYGDMLRPQRMGARLLAAFGVLALVLALVGVYGVVQFVVAQRRREIGIRIALGAEPGAMVSLALRGALVAVGIGVVGGLALAAAASGAAGQFLIGVDPVDPTTYAVAAGLLLAAAAGAALGPARRASRVDPSEALRHE